MWFIYLFFWLVINNSIEINKVIYCDNVKNELDAENATHIYEDIQTIENYENKSVVFLGALDEYQLPYNVSLGRESIFRHDIIGENCLSNETLNFRIYSLFRLLGMPVKEADDSQYVRALLMCSASPNNYPGDGYIQASDDLIVVKLGDCSAIKTTDKSQIQEDVAGICGNTDLYDVQNDTITVDGWGYITGITSNRVKKYLAFAEQSSGQVYMIRCANIAREDVVQGKNIEKSYKWCGYHIQIDKALLPAGTYELRLILESGGILYDSSQEFGVMQIP